MERKSAIKLLAIMAAAAAQVYGQTGSTSTTRSFNVVVNPKTRLFLDLNIFADDAIEVEYKGETRTVSREELWNALK